MGIEKQTQIIVDGNGAVSLGSYPFTELAAIYPITPSSPMAENIDVYATAGQLNFFGEPVKVAELQSEGGAAGTVHGAAQAGSLATTYTASQGLLLMIPNIYKWVGEELPIVVHVAARSLATQALSIFGDHQDIYAVRQTGIAMLCSQSVQDAMDLSSVAHLIAIKASYPVLHFMDGFRTSHEYAKIERVPSEAWKSLIDRDALAAFQKRALNPHGNPVVRGGAQNDDVYFQAREAQNQHQNRVLTIAEEYLSKASELTGRTYAPFVYVGDPFADWVIVAMGSVTETIQETIEDLNAKGAHLGLVKVYLYRPFSPTLLAQAIPSSVKAVAVLDRTKEPLATGEPLYLDVLSALNQMGRQGIKVVGGRYGLSSHDTTPKDIKAVYDFLESPDCHTDFTIGIVDDVTHLSLPVDENYAIQNDDRSCLFYGMGSDGTVSANKLAAKIIGDITDLNIQAYFQYDSKKAGGITRSHLRFGKKPIRSEYYVTAADFVSCSQDSYVSRYDMAKFLKVGGTFLLNTSVPKEELPRFLANAFKRELAKKKARLFVIDANTLARKLGLGRHTNTLLESAFFYLNRDVFDYGKAIGLMKSFAAKQYAKKGEDIVKANQAAIDMGTQGLTEIEVDPSWAQLDGTFDKAGMDTAYVRDFVDVMESFEGYSLPVSSFLKFDSEDGTMVDGLALDRKRAVADMVPHWLKDNCIQCGQCVMVCPHATIRAFMLTDEEIQKLDPSEQKDVLPAVGGPKVKGLKYRIQINPMSCVGCSLCVSICPGKFDKDSKTFKKALVMSDAKEEYVHQLAADYLYRHVEYRQGYFPAGSIKETALLKPYHEVSAACAGCGETPYYRLLSQLYGPDLLIANATGCSSIYCGSYPVAPFAKDDRGNGIAWANSLFEDNAEYGYGMRLSQDIKFQAILGIIQKWKGQCDPALQDTLDRYVLNLKNIPEERKVIPTLIAQIQASACQGIKGLLDYRNDLLDKSVWIIGGDGWAYDIGYGGLDQVLSTKDDVNILVLDTEVYSNTGGQASKSSQLGQIAKFAASGKKTAKKNLALLAMAYGDVYVAQVAMGANIPATIKALREAESYHDGPSIVIAYCPCIEHGIKGGLSNGIRTEKEAVQCGYWPIFRYDPRLKAQGKAPLVFDSREPDFNKFNDFVMTETRFSRLYAVNPTHAQAMLDESRESAKQRYFDIKNFGNGQGQASLLPPKP